MSINNDKFVRIISTFSAEDWKKFNYYLKSPYFVRGRDYTVIYLYLYKAFKYSGKLDADILGKVFNKILSNENIDRNTLQTRMYELTSIAINYIKQKLSEKNELANNYYYLEFLSDNLLHREFDSVFDIDIENLQTSEKSLHELQLISNILHLKLKNELLKKKYVSAFTLFYKNSLLEVTILLSTIFYYAIESFEIEHLYFDQSFNPISDIVKNGGFDNIMKQITVIDSPVFSRAILYYYLYEILVNNRDKEYLSILISIYHNSEKKLSKDLKLYFSNRIKGYYISKINEGDTSYIKHLFRLYKSELEDGKIPGNIILHREKIFDNHVAIGLKAEEFDYVKNFIENNIKSLSKEMQEEFYILSITRLYFATKDYKKALEVIKRIKNKITNGIILRFKMRILYELAMTEEAFLEVDRLKHFIKRNKNMRTDEMKKMKLFLTHYLRLLKLNTSPSHKAYEEFVLGLNKSKVLIPSIDWLREKTDEIKKL